MKKWFKRNTNRIFALAIVCIIVFAMCISISADDEELSTFPTDIDDESMIITYICDDYFSPESPSTDTSSYSYNFQVIPPNSFDNYVAQYIAEPKGVINYSVDGSTYRTHFYDNAGNGQLLIFNRTFLIHNILLSRDNYLMFSFGYFAQNSALKPTLTISISYRLNNTSTVFNETFTFNEFDVETILDTSAFYTLLGVDNTLTINIDSLEFNLHDEFVDNIVNSVSFGLSVYYNLDTILVDTTNTPSDDSTDIPSAVFRDYVSWIAVAVGGFFAFELFPNFYLGGILVIMIAFTLVMWWLKMFGGG